MLMRPVPFSLCLYRFPPSAKKVSQSVTSHVAVDDDEAAQWFANTWSEYPSANDATSLYEDRTETYAEADASCASRIMEKHW